MYDDNDNDYKNIIYFNIWIRINILSKGIEKK